MKICKKCLETKDDSCFYLSKGICKICYDKKSREYQKLNKEIKAKSDKNWYDKNKSKKLEYCQKWKKERRKDSFYRLTDNRRARRNEVINKIKSGNFSSWSLKSLQCSLDEWKKHLESKFHSGMSWDNYGSHWHLDEVIPILAWDLTNEFEAFCCWHFLNSQPLLVRDNLKKSKDKSFYEQEKELFKSRVRQC